MKILMLVAGILAFSPLLADVPSPPTQLCVDDNCQSVTGQGQGSIKWHPGHYMLVFRGESHATIMTQRIPEICKESALQGLQVRMDWGKLENGKGNYDFSRVDEMYDALESCGKRLIMQIQVANFNSTDATGLVPGYLLVDPEYKGGVAKTRSGFIARLWEESVMTRLVALGTALGARYDNKPNFEGIVLAETATGQVADGYGFTGTAYVGQLERGIASMLAAWPTTNLIVFNNYIQGVSDAQLIDFVQFLRSNRSTMGGPDTLPPPHSSTKGESIYRGVLGGVDMRRLMPAMFAVQTPELGGKEGTFSPKELYDHCVGTNRCSHMFWIRNMTNGGVEQHWDTGILPFLRLNPRTDETCPANYAGCVR
jgi:hypothetical protein